MNPEIIIENEFMSEMMGYFNYEVAKKCFDCGEPSTMTFTSIEHEFNICEKCYEENIDEIGQEYSLKSFHEEKLGTEKQ